jgi:hypothetical protein
MDMAAATKGKADSATTETKAMDTAHKALVGLQPDEQERVLAWLYQRLKLSAPIGIGGAGGSGAGTGGGAGGGAGIGTGAALLTAGAPGTAAHAKAFMVMKKPADFQERVACLAYYLTHHMNSPHFKTRDISSTNGLAGQTKLSNPAKFVSNAVHKAQYLSSAGKGQQQITARGEALVEALPGREAVKTALAEHPLAGRRGKGKGRRAKAKTGS